MSLNKESSAQSSWSLAKCTGRCRERELERERGYTEKDLKIAKRIKMSVCKMRTRHCCTSEVHAYRTTDRPTAQLYAFSLCTSMHSRDVHFSFSRMHNESSFVCAKENAATNYAIRIDRVPCPLAPQWAMHWVYSACISTGDFFSVKMKVMHADFSAGQRQRL